MKPPDAMKFLARAAVAVFLIGLGVLNAPAADAAARTLLVVGLGGDLAHARRYAEAGTSLAASVRRAGFTRGLLYLHEDGFIPPEVTLRSGAAPIKPDGSAAKTNLLAALAEAAGGDGPSDSLLIFLVGHADARAAGTEGMQGVAWNFHLPGPDLSLAELETALKPYPGRVLLVVATPYAGTVTRLAGPRRGVLAVTRGDEKFPLAQPEVIAQSLDALTGSDTPATLTTLAAILEARTAAWYTANDFLRTEHQNVSGDREITTAPLYGPEKAWQLRPTTTAPTELGADPLDSELDLLALMRLAREGDPAAPPGTEAVILLRALDLAADEAGMVTERRREIIHVLAPRARDRADVSFYYSPPDESWELIAARVITADTVQEVVPKEIVEEPVMVEGAPQEDAGASVRAATVVQIFLPGMQPGAIADVAYTRRSRTFGVAMAPGLDLLFGDQDPIRQLNFRMTIPKRLRLTVATRRLPELEKREGRYGRVYRLTVRDLPAFKPEPMAPPPPDVLPRLLILETENWDEIARWYARLTEAARAVNPEVDAQADRVITTDPVRELYDWVARKIRYVAIPLGVHTTKPHLPAETLRRGYGDCKDKASLLIAALAGRGIAAYITLIGAGGGELIAEAPRQSAFNHAIVAIPTPGRSEPFLFLDPTAELAPFGTLPDMDEGREVLVVMGDTGIITRTPISIPEQNRIEILRDARLTPTGLEVSETRTLTGLAAFQHRRLLRLGGPDAMKQYLTEQLTRRFAGAALREWRDENGDSVTAPYLISLHYLVPAPAGMIPVPVGTADYVIPAPPRTLPIQLPATVLIREITEIDLAGAPLPSLPDPVTVTNQAGSVQLSYAGLGPIVVTRTLRLPQRDLPAAAYPELYQLLAPQPVFLGGPPAAPAPSRIGWWLAGGVVVLLVMLFGIVGLIIFVRRFR